MHRNARFDQPLCTKLGRAMPKEPIDGPEPTFSEDDIQREQLGPRGVPGVEDPAKMTPQRGKKMPKNVDPGHPA